MDFWYYVYREQENSTALGKYIYIEIGRTRYKEDAEAILDRWHSGYIVHNGDFVKRKNIHV